MVKLPISPDPVPPEYIEGRTQFLHDYGALLAVWSEFELAIEVKIAELTGMKPLDASIVLGGLNFGSKAMGLTLDRLEEYGRGARLFEPTPPRRQGRPPREGSGSKSANARRRG